MSLAIGVMGVSVHAQTPPASLNQQVIEQRQQQLLDRTRSLRQSLEYSSQPDTSTQAVNKDSQAPCARIDHIVWQGIEAFDEWQRMRDQWDKGMLGQCLSIARIQQLARDASNDLINRGWVTSRVEVPPQRIDNGILQLRVEPGRIEAITLDDTSSPALGMLFPGQVGNILNLRTIEQGMEQINRLPSRQVTIDLQPGSRPGFSVVALRRVDPQATPVHLSVGMDNSGQKDTGVRQGSLGLTLDSPLGLYDQWSLNAGHDLSWRSGQRSQYAQMNMTVPYGDWTFGANAMWNEALRQLPAYGMAWRYREMNRQYQLMASRMLYRDGVQKLGLTASLARHDTDTTLQGQTLEVSSPTLTLITVGVDYARSLWGGYLTFSPGLTQGVNTLGARQPSDSSMPSISPTLWTVSASYFHPLTESIDYLGTLYGQATADHLYSSEQVSVGGQYSVRGFKDQYLSANRGGYWRNQLDWTLPDLPYSLGTPSLTIALDGGWVDPQHSQFVGGTVMGSAVALSIDSHYLSQSVTVGMPVVHPSGMSPDRWVAYWRVSASI